MPLRLQLLDPHFQMQAQLLVHFRRHARLAAEIPERGGGSSRPAARRRRRGVAAPVRGFFAQPLPPGRREGVEAGAAVVLGRCPFGLDQVLPIEAMKRLVEGGVLDAQVTAGAVAHRWRRCRSRGAARTTGIGGPADPGCPARSGSGIIAILPLRRCGERMVRLAARGTLTVLLHAEKAINRRRGPSAIVDRPDDERLAALHVAGGKHAGHAGHPLLVAPDGAAIGQTHVEIVSRGLFSGPTKPIASSTRSAVISNALPGTGSKDARPSVDDANDLLPVQRANRPRSSPTNSVVAIA